MANLKSKSRTVMLKSMTLTDACLKSMTVTDARFNCMNLGFVSGGTRIKQTNSGVRWLIIDALAWFSCRRWAPSNSWQQSTLAWARGWWLRNLQHNLVVLLGSTSMHELCSDGLWTPINAVQQSTFVCFRGWC